MTECAQAAAKEMPGSAQIAVEVQDGLVRCVGVGGGGQFLAEAVVQHEPTHAGQRLDVGTGLIGRTDQQHDDVDRPIVPAAEINRRGRRPSDMTRLSHAADLPCGTASPLPMPVERVCSRSITA